MLIFIQIAISIFNTGYKIAVLKVVEEKESVHVILFLFFEILLPIIACLFSSVLCLKQYFLNLFLPEYQAITSHYSVNYCSLFSAETLSCLQDVTTTIYSQFYPVFVYTNQCRNAVFQVFFPIVIFTTALNSYALPLFYAFVARRFERNHVVSSLVPEVFWPRAAKSIPVQSLVVDIITSFVALLAYGTMNPLVCGVLFLSLICKISFYEIVIGRFVYFNLNCESDCQPNSMACCSNSCCCCIPNKTSDSNRLMKCIENIITSFQCCIRYLFPKSVKSGHYCGTCTDTQTHCVKCCELCCTFSAQYLSTSVTFSIMIAPFIFGVFMWDMILDESRSFTQFVFLPFCFLSLGIFLCFCYPNYSG